MEVIFLSRFVPSDQRIPGFDGPGSRSSPSRRPFFAKDFGDLSTAFIPIFLDSDLDQVNVGLSNNPLSNGDGQHSNYISEQLWGRQQKSNPEPLLIYYDLWCDSLAYRNRHELR